VNGRDNRGRRRPFRRDNRRNDPSKQEKSAHPQEDKNSGDPRNTTPGIRAKGSEDGGAPRLWKRKDKPDFDRNGSPSDKPVWTAPKPNTDPLPVLNCIRCGLPITDPFDALSDRKSGAPVHFDCVFSELAEQEILEAGDTLSYIGGGRFGIVHLNGEKGDTKKFTIKKIFEWEDKEKRAEWRGVIADRYSIT